MRIRLLDDDNKRDNLGVVKRTVWGLARDDDGEVYEAGDGAKHVDDVAEGDDRHLDTVMGAAGEAVTVRESFFPAQVLQRVGTVLKTKCRVNQYDIIN